MQKLAAAAGAALLSAFSALSFGADVGVSVTIGQPGFFGRIDLGDAPPPQLINPEPMIIERIPGAPPPPPIYLHVPPGYERHWRRYCHQYNACGQPVYFVRDDWYNRVYVPHYRDLHREHGDRHDERRDDHRGDERRDDEHRGEEHHGDEHHDRRDDHREGDDRH